ncbi:MAG: FHA domain-containing protein [Acidimicrobiales bacterium]
MLRAANLVPLVMPSEASPATLVTDAGSAAERVYPIKDRFFIGRECAGIEPDRRLLVDDPAVSRVHAEVRWDAPSGQGYVVDTSTNGTRVNGRRIERISPVLLHSGDEILVGQTALRFQAGSVPPQRLVAEVEHRATVNDVGLVRMAMVVGDIVSYSTISEQTETTTLTQELNRLYDMLFELLVTHGGTLNNYVGDAFFAIWEIDHIPDAVLRATTFALDAARAVHRVAGSIGLTSPDGSPLRMGWAVTSGLVGVSTMTGKLVTVLGDQTNVAFRLSGLAAREGRGEVIVTDEVPGLVGAAVHFDNAEEVLVKGRMTPVRIRSAHDAPQ